MFCQYFFMDQDEKISWWNFFLNPFFLFSNLLFPTKGWPIPLDDDRSVISIHRLGVMVNWFRSPGAMPRALICDASSVFLYRTINWVLHHKTPLDSHQKTIGVKCTILIIEPYHVIPSPKRQFGQKGMIPRLHSKRLYACNTTAWGSAPGQRSHKRKPSGFHAPAAQNRIRWLFSKPIQRPVSPYKVRAST